MVKTSPRLLYVSDLTPRPGQGGQVVLDRHLRRLAAEDWSLDMVGTRPCPPGPWTSQLLPRRRFWWPPFRLSPGWLATLRGLAWEWELRRLPAPDLLLTVTGGQLPWLAARLAARRRIPLAVIVHDHWRETGSPVEARVAEQVCERAALLFAVSEEMREALAARFGAAKTLVLPPIPAERTLPFAAWREEHARRPVVAHVGALHPYHAPFLRQLAETLRRQNGRLLVLCPEDNPVLRELRASVPELIHQPFFPDNTDALRFIAGRATALVVMYPFGGAGTPVPTGFPSRFIEFSQLGLPILLAAPEGNPIRAWARRHRWPAHFTPDDMTALATHCSALVQPEAWEHLAAATRGAAEGDFDPDRIHRLFSERLRASISR